MSEVQQPSSASVDDQVPGSSGGPGPSGSRKRTREDDSDPGCIGGCGSSHCTVKKNASGECSSSVRWWFVRLESEDENYDSDTPESLMEESVWSNQDADTEPVIDPDEYSLSDDDENRWQAHHRIEFEIATDHSSSMEEEGPFGKRARRVSGSTTCSSDLEAAAAVVAVATSEVLCDYYADSSSECSDPELQPQDKWTCLDCKEKNAPLPRYCQKCFSGRKKWFPPRPRKRGLARRQLERSKAEARRAQMTSHSFPPGRSTKESPESSQSQPQPGTSQSQNFVRPLPFVQTSPSVPACLPTPPQSQEDLRISTQNSQKQITTLEDIDAFLKNIKEKRNQTETKISSQESVASTNILTSSQNEVIENSQEQGEDETDAAKFIRDFVNSCNSFMSNRENNGGEDVVDLGQKSYPVKVVYNLPSEDVVDQKIQIGASTIVVDNAHPDSEDVVDFCRKIEPSTSTSYPQNSSEDVVDFCRKIEPSTSTSYPQNSSEDVVDFCRKIEPSTSTFYSQNSSVGRLNQVCSLINSSENSLNFYHKFQASTSAQNTSKVNISSIPEDVVDFCPKSLPGVSSQPCEEDVTDSVAKSSQAQSSQGSQSIFHGSQSPKRSRPDSPESAWKLCCVCNEKPADTALKHGNIAHQCVCYKCAKKIYQSIGKQCPVCRRKTSSYCKIFN